MKSAEQIEAEKKDQQSSGGGGVGGMLARRMMKKPDVKARATFLTVTHDVLSVSTDVAAGDVAIPAGFKER